MSKFNATLDIMFAIVQELHKTTVHSRPITLKTTSVLEEQIPKQGDPAVCQRQAVGVQKSPVHVGIETEGRWKVG